MSPPRATAADRADDAPLFAALGDQTRLALVDRLANDGPQSITRLTAGLTVTRQAITKHLEILADAGLVHDSWRGRERLWQLDPDRLDAARRRLDETAQHWDEALARLTRFVEDDQEEDVRCAAPDSAPHEQSQVPHGGDGRARRS